MKNTFRRKIVPAEKGEQKMKVMCNFEIIKVDERKSYMAFPNCPFRLVIEDGECVGWYYCGEVE